jgi:hypothetical protein
MRGDVRIMKRVESNIDRTGRVRSGMTEIDPTEVGCVQQPGQLPVPPQAVLADAGHLLDRLAHRYLFDMIHIRLAVLQVLLHFDRVVELPGHVRAAPGQFRRYPLFYPFQVGALFGFCVIEYRHVSRSPHTPYWSMGDVGRGY